MPLNLVRLRMEVQRDRDAGTLILSQSQYARKTAARFLTVSDFSTVDSPLDETVALVPEQSPVPGSAEHSDMARHRRGG